MRKINKIINIAVIFMLMGVFLVQDFAYALRPPLQTNKLSREVKGFLTIDQKPASDNVAYSVYEIAMWKEAYAQERAKPIILPGETPSTFIKRLVDTRIILPGNNILTLGTWMGHDELYLAGNGCYVLATDFIDNSLEDLKKAAAKRKLQAYIETTIYNIRKPLNFSPHSFDGIFGGCLSPLQYLEDDEIAKWAKEMRNIVRPGGIIAFSVRSINDRIFQGEYVKKDGVFVVGVGYKGGPSKKRQRGFTKELLRAFFEKGFESVSIIEREVKRREGVLDTMLELVAVKSQEKAGYLRKLGRTPELERFRYRNSDI